MNYIALSFVATILMATASPCFAHEVQVLKFRFEIPDTWRTEGGGIDKERLFATGTASKEMFAPPNILVEACSPTKLQGCVSFQWPDPPKDLQAHGCASAIAQVLLLPGGIEETRWVCETIRTSDGPITGGISVFRHQGASLVVAHSSEGGPIEVSRFLDGLAQSLKIMGEIEVRPN